jgi:hypothetical protein
MYTERAESFGIKTNTTLEDGIRVVTEWFKANKNSIDQRYNVFVNH